jgi:hypothetical protein
MNAGIMTKLQRPTGITLLARINLVIYILLLFWALSFVLSIVDLISISFALYSIAGIACSSGLLQQKRWSWYMAVIMWMVEGAVSCWAVYANSESFFMYPQSAIIFLLIPLFKFASTAYIVKRKIREGFDIYKHTSARENT